MLGLTFAHRFPFTLAYQPSSQNAVPSGAVSSPTNTPATSVKKVEIQQYAQPQTLTIPKINLQAAVEAVGEDNLGRMDVPEKVDDVGWYKLGYKPGEKGSAVMDGHLDTATGAPAAFYYIDQLAVGDQVIVTDKNGKNFNFEVTRVQSYPFDQLPLQEVFASNDKPRLNLITCAGTWNSGSRNYSNRLVIYTELKS